MSEPGTESKIRDLMELFFAHARNNAYVHYAQSYTGDPARPGLFVCLVSCPDEMAFLLKARMNEIVPAEFSNGGYAVQKPKIQ